MLSTVARVGSRGAARTVTRIVVENGSTRNMATLREIEQRLKSIKNISKITATMKMIASTKLTRAQRAMETARVYGTAGSEIYHEAETTAPEGGKTLYITVSSDKGLCGGIHSSVSKKTRKLVDADQNSSVVVLGDKAKAQLSRAIPEHLSLTFASVGKDVPTFADAATIADTIFSSGVEFDKIEIIYNHFKSVIAYEAMSIQAYSEETFKASPKFAAYEVEDDVTANLGEFSLANAIYWALVEGHACEISARRTAMENASNNASDMIDKLTLFYNRSRQAQITNELVDIITGASAL